jgi:FkbM family methyltransferase
MSLNIRGGARICVPSSIELMTPYVLLEQDDWFEEEILFVRKALRPGQRAVDIGANHGVYSVALAGAVGATGRVWSVEPAATTADLLEETMRLNGMPQSALIRGAVSDRTGCAHLRTGEHSELNALTDSKADGVAVPAWMLDDLARAHGLQGIDFLKIDAEGHEARILEGARAFLKAESPLVMFEIAAGAKRNVALEDRLRAAGYGIFRLIPGLDLLAPLAPAEKMDPFLFNLFACKADRAEKLEQEGFLTRDAGSDAADTDGDDPLTTYRASRDAALAPGERYRRLRAARGQASDEFNVSPSLPALLTYARIVSDLGLRSLAVQSVRIAQSLVAERWQEIADKPFLAPMARFDAIPFAGAERAWLDCALVESELALGQYSTFFTGAQDLPKVEALAGNPLRGPETERRRQLIRLRAGLQRRPEPHALVVAASERNLNPAYWQSFS